MYKVDLPSILDPYAAAQAAGRGLAGNAVRAAVETGWHLSSFDLAQGLRVVEADDEELLALFRTPPPPLP